MALKTQLNTTNGQPQPPNNYLKQMNNQNQLTTNYTMDWKWIQSMLKKSKKYTKSSIQSSSNRKINSRQTNKTTAEIFSGICNNIT